MSRIAQKTGIGWATLYKYFSDAGAVLSAWHQRPISHHLAHLNQVRARSDHPGECLNSVLETYGLIVHRRGRHSAELIARLHSSEDATIAQRQLVSLIQDLLAEAAGACHDRDDIAPEELAGYCLHALAAAGDLSSEVAVCRLVRVVVAGLKPGA